MTKKAEPQKRLVGVVCVLHGTFDGIAVCPICDGFRANNSTPACEGGCGTAKKPVRRFAFVAGSHGTFNNCMGRADEAVDGWTPIIAAGQFRSYEAAFEMARAWNLRMGYTPEEALMVAASTMRGQNLKDRIEKLTALLKTGREQLIGAVGGYKLLDPDQKKWADEIEKL